MYVLPSLCVQEPLLKAAQARLVEAQRVVSRIESIRRHAKLVRDCCLLVSSFPPSPSPDRPVVYGVVQGVDEVQARIANLQAVIATREAARQRLLQSETFAKAKRYRAWKEVSARRLQPMPTVACPRQLAKPDAVTGFFCYNAGSRYFMCLQRMVTLRRQSLLRRHAERRSAARVGSGTVTADAAPEPSPIGGQFGALLFADLALPGPPPAAVAPSSSAMKLLDGAYSGGWDW